MHQGEVEHLGSVRWQAALTWWNARRLAYNVALLGAGIVAFGLYAIAFEIWAPRNDPDFEITAFTILFQGVGYLFCIGAANVVFFVGPAVEQIISESSLYNYRRWAFGAGVVFSVLLPMLVPLLFYFEYGLGH